MEKEPVFLEAQNVTKSFFGVRALVGVNFQLRAGEIHILIGENGAGKSTLIKVFSGANSMDEGELLIEGHEITIHNPHHARQLGIFTIYQEFCLIPFLTVAENIFLGSERTVAGFLDKSYEMEESSKLLKSLGFDIDPRAYVKDLEVPKKQMVEIAKALRAKGRLLMLDEPTAALTNKERDRLFEILRHLKKEGVGIIYISHRLEEVKMIGDRITVLRDGYVVGSLEVAENTNTNELVQLMTGKEIKQKFPKENIQMGRPIFHVRGLTAAPLFSDIHMTGHAGEILAVFGLPGCGSLEVARAITGALKYDTGTIDIQGVAKPVQAGTPRAALEAGICLLPPERKEEGIVLLMPLGHNITLSSLHLFVKRLFIRQSKETVKVSSLITKLGIKTPGVRVPVAKLSGGNQQKAVLAKALCREAKVFVFCEPTRGIDVGAKVEIYRLASELLKEGAFILMVSSELPEILGMGDRVLVMYKGKIAAELSRSEAQEDVILEYAFGHRAGNVA